MKWLFMRCSAEKLISYSILFSLLIAYGVFKLIFTYIPIAMCILFIVALSVAAINGSGYCLFLLFVILFSFYSAGAENYFHGRG